MKIKKMFSSIVVFVIRTVVSLRYRVEIKGLEDVQRQLKGQKGGILFLPNHPAEMDPIILMSRLWWVYQPRPLVVEHFYRLPGVAFFMRLARALPLPTMDFFANQWKARQVEKAFKKVASELAAGENFLIYPSGRLKHTGLEVLGGASFVHQLLQHSPEAKIVLIRTTGLWGSRFSRALTGSSPALWKVVLEGFKILLKNGIFFAPRRRVLVEMESTPLDFPRKGSKLELNHYLEKWYNRYPEAGPEPLKFVSSYFWKKAFPSVVAKELVKQGGSELPVPESVQKDVLEFVAKLARRPAEGIEKEMQLSRDLGLDSLDITQVHLFLDDKFHISHVPPGQIVTVGDIFQTAVGYLAETEEESAAPLPTWSKEERLEPIAAMGSTLPEAFLRMCRRMGKSAACADRLSGIWSYEKLERIVLILSQKIAKLPGSYIAVMLPATSTTYALVLAILIAKKTPVMLNWTAGVRSLDHAVSLLNLKVVLSSRRFLNQMENGDIGKVDDLLVLLEEMRETIGLKEKLKGVWLSLKSPAKLLKKLQLSRVSEEETAVVLFTSGTESLPKAVPLSHANLLANQRAALSCVGLTKKDVMYGVLPPFHSFGFSVTGLLPLLAGVKCCYGPNPNDSQALAKDIDHWQATLFCSAPSFLRALFRVAPEGGLQSVRLFVSGAEKATPDLYEHVRTRYPKAQLIEGYGITECSPIVTICRPGKLAVGVGQLIPGIELCTIDHETGALLPHGTEGEICIRGKSVFAGYIGHPTDPFILIKGLSWYRSGDRGSVDSEENLILSGRLKRFVKIGGEMVSLGGLEEEILRLAFEKKWQKDPTEGPALAISAHGKESDKPLIILFTTFDIAKEEVNAALKESGYGRIVKIGEVRRLAEIPLTGTGKTHYRLLDEMV